MPGLTLLSEQTYEEWYETASILQPLMLRLALRIGAIWACYRLHARYCMNLQDP